MHEGLQEALRNQAGEAVMKMRTIHCCLDVSGGIKNAKTLLGCIRVNGKLLRTEKEVKAFLREQQEMGRRVIPIGDCDNFDYQTGCKGHPIRGEEQEAAL